MEGFENHTGKLFIMSGPSGAGKGTICQRLIAETDVQLSVSATTRAPRPGEIEGVSYFFMDKDAFLENVEKGKFLEHATVYGNYYGTPKDKVEEKLSQGIDVVLEIDIQGAMKVKENYPDGVFIFILPPSMAELRKRITGRGSETEEVINYRLSQTLNEISYMEKYDYCVVNGDLDEAVKRVKAIVIAEHSKVKNDVSQLIERYKREEM